MIDKRTPEPWIAEPVGDGNWRVVAPADKPDLPGTRVVCHCAAIDPGEAEANARLIAETGPLLTAAKSLVARAQPYSKSVLDSGYRYEVCQSAVKRLEDAIAKVEGR